MWPPMVDLPASAKKTRWIITLGPAYNENTLLQRADFFTTAIIENNVKKYA